MKVVLTDPREGQCTWCEKAREVVTASFSDRFLVNAPVCWRCLATSVRVRAKTAAAEHTNADQKSGEGDQATKTPGGQAEPNAKP